MVSTGLPSAAGSGRNAESARRTSSWERRHAQAVGLTGVGGEDAGPAAVGEDRHRPAAGQRLVGQQGRDIEELPEGVRAHDARLVEQGIDRDVRGADQRAGVGRGCPGARRRAAALDRDDRLGPSDAARDARELARVPDRFQVQGDDGTRGVRFPVLKEVVAGQVRLVPDRDEAGESQAQPVRVLDDGQAEGAALRQEPDPALDRQGGGEGGVEADLRLEVDHAHAVRADQPHAGTAAHGHEVALSLQSLRTRFREAGGDDDDALDALGGAGARSLQGGLGGQDDDGKIDRPRDVEDRSIGGHRLHDVGGRVDGVDGPCKAGREQVVEELAADRAPAPGRSDHCDGRWVEQRPDGRRGRCLLPPLEPFTGGSRELGRELHDDGPGLGMHANREAAGPEDLEHAHVLGQNLGDERGDAQFIGAAGELLEEQRRDPTALVVVGDHERDLRRVGVDAVVAPVADDPVGGPRLGTCDLGRPRLGARGQGDERAALGALGRGPPVRASDEVRAQAREPEAPGLGVEALEEGDEGDLVGRRGIADPDRGPVAQDRVSRTILGPGGAGTEHLHLLARRSSARDAAAASDNPGWTLSQRSPPPSPRTRADRA